jgi:hypothetical protein
MHCKWFISLSITLISSILSELRFVFNIFRHGARTPVVLGNHGADMFHKTWKQGDGELTAIGMRMHYLLGARNRIKYEGFLSKHYDPNELYVMSTSRNRTIMSALSQLHALYPPEVGPTIPNAIQDEAVPPVSIKGLEEIQKELNLDALKYRIQPVPVHLIPDDTQTFSLHDVQNCPPIEPIRSQYNNVEAIMNYVKEFKEKYSSILMKVLSLKEEVFDSFSNLYIIADTFVSGYTEGLDYSFLEASGINLKEFNETCHYNFQVKFSEMYNVQDAFIGHMSMSPFHLSIVEWMDTRVKYDKDVLGYVTYKAPKYIMLSGHDTNIAAIQAYFKKVFPNQFPGYDPIPFAASLFYELHRKAGANTYEHKDYYVEVIYNDKLLFKLNYDEFRSNILTKSFKQAAIDNFCGFSVSDSSPVDTWLVIANICFSVMSLALIIMVVVLYRKIYVVSSTYNIEAPLLIN